MNRKKISRQILLMLVLVNLLSGVPIQAQNTNFPYKLGKSDYILVPLGLATYYGGESWIDSKGIISEEEISMLNRNDINKFDRHSTEIFSLKADNASDLIRTSLVLLPGFLVGHQCVKGKWHQTLTLGLMYYETYLYTRGLTAIVKSMTGRIRPYLYNDNLSVTERFEYTKERDSYGSFFSGHTSAMFASATFLSKTFTDIYGKSTLSYVVLGTSLTAATIGSYFRYKSGEHYPTDVLAGALFGAAIGYAIPVLHKKSISESFNFSVTPGSFYVSLKF